MSFEISIKSVMQLVEYMENRIYGRMWNRLYYEDCFLQESNM